MLPIKQIKKNVIFDFEVFPEWWVVCFRNIDNPDDVYLISSDTYEYKNKLLNILSAYRLIGFNIKAYDLLIYNAILCDQTPAQVYQVSEDIMNNVNNKWTKTFTHYRWNWIDLYNDWKFGSLKMYEANTGLSIVETTIPFGKKNLTDEEKAEIIRYCYADTLATYKLWLERKDYFSIHEFVSETYGVPLQKAYQKTMGSLTAEAMKANKPMDIMPEDKRQDIYVLDYIDKILGVTPFDYLLTDSQEEQIFMIDGDKFKLGVGGVHSDYDEPIIVESKNGKTVWSIDVTQYYPHMLTMFNLMPRSVPTVGVQIYKGMIEKVKSLKREMNSESDPVKAKRMKEKRDKYKVLINAVSGAMRNKWSKFYDPSRIITMCAVGQFLLIAVVVDIKKSFPGTEILQTNTDGAYLLIPDEYDIHSKMKEIMAICKFEFEVDKADKLVQRDVNNYALVMGKKVKTKGAWIYENRPRLNPAKYAICRMAVFNELIHGIPIVQTIMNNKDIMNFVSCSKTGSSYDETVYTLDGKDIPTSNTNRFIASKNVKAGMLYKIKYKADGTQSRSQVPDCPTNAMLLNEDISTYDFDDLNIDYNFYIRYANDLLPSFHIFQ